MPAPHGLNIPAMTTDAERECYYRLAKEATMKGSIVEFGAWMGASTAYIAAGVRDADEGKVGKVIVFDKFQSKPGHIRKVREFYSKKGIDKAPVGPCLATFKANLGGLMKFVAPVPGQIEQTVKQKWADNSISLIVTDAPKRVPAISAVLTALRNAVQPGCLMAWQDFCHFPSYEIPACLYRIRHHLEFVEAVVPGTTLVFRIKSQWKLTEVSMATLDLGTWTPAEIFSAWVHWAPFIAPEKFELFQCGAALFLCDIGYPEEAVAALSTINLQPIVKKWRYLRDARPDFLIRYAPLFQYLEKLGVFEMETVNG